MSQHATLAIPVMPPQCRSLLTHLRPLPLLQKVDVKQGVEGKRRQRTCNANASVAELIALSCAGFEILLDIFLSTVVPTWSGTTAHQSDKLGSLVIVPS